MEDWIAAYMEYLDAPNEEFLDRMEAVVKETWDDWDHRGVNGLIVRKSGTITTADLFRLLKMPLKRNHKRRK